MGCLHIAIVSANQKSISPKSDPVVSETVQTQSTLETEGTGKVSNCPGGCTSGNARCRGACCAAEWRSGEEVCGQNNGCLRIRQLDGTFRYECWEMGPEWGDGIAPTTMRGGFVMEDVSSIDYVVFRSQLDGGSWVALDDTVYTSTDTTESFYDEKYDESTQYDSLKYEIKCYNNSHQLQETIIWAHYD